MLRRRREDELELLRSVVGGEVDRALSRIYEWLRELYAVVRGLEGRIREVNDGVLGTRDSVRRGFEEALKEVRALRDAVERLAGEVSRVISLLESVEGRLTALAGGQRELGEMIASLMGGGSARVGEVDRAAIFLAQCAVLLRDEGLAGDAGLMAERGPVTWSYLWRRGVSAGDVVRAVKLLRAGAGGRRAGDLEAKGLVKRVRGSYASTSLLRAILYHVVLVASRL